MALTRKHYKELAVIMGKHQGKVLRKEFHANIDLFEELTEFLQADNKNFSYSIFLDAFHDATEKYLREKEKDKNHETALRNASKKLQAGFDALKDFK